MKPMNILPFLGFQSRTVANGINVLAAAAIVIGTSRTTEQELVDFFLISTMSLKLLELILGQMRDMGFFSTHVSNERSIYRVPTRRKPGRKRVVASVPPAVHPRPVPEAGYFVAYQLWPELEYRHQPWLSE